MKDPLTPDLLHELCHDLRGPLGAIGTWVSVLKSERADGETRARALVSMTGDVRALGELIDQISALAEAISGPANISPAPIDLVPFVKSACASLAEDGRDLTFHSDDASLFALADPVRLRQVLEVFASEFSAERRRGSAALRVGRRDQMAELTLEGPGTPGILSVTLARALAEAQGCSFEESVQDGVTRLHVLLPLAP